MGKIDYSSHWYTDDQLSYLEKGPARHHNRKRIAYLIKTIEGFGFKSPKILDAGCGDGAMTRYFLRVKGAQITGLDYNELRLERARKLMPELNFVKGDLLKMPFKENTFDIVILHHVLEHIKEDKAVLKEILRVLRPGGFLVLGVPNEGGIVCRIRNKYVQPQIMKRTDHVNFYTLESLGGIISSINGFDVVKTDWVGGIVLPHYKAHMLLSQFKFFDDLFNDLAQKAPIFAGSLYFIARKRGGAKAIK